MTLAISADVHDMMDALAKGGDPAAKRNPDLDNSAIVRRSLRGFWRLAPAERRSIRKTRACATRADRVVLRLTDVPAELVGDLTPREVRAVVGWRVRQAYAKMTA